MKFSSQPIIALFFPVSFLLITSCGEKGKPSEKQSEPLKVIFDSDMGPDYDDVGAIAMLHAFADRDEAEILATMASTKYEGVAAVLNVLNTYFNRPDLPIGVPKGHAVTMKDFQNWSDTLIAKYPHKIMSNNEVPDAVALYREILAKQPDSSVTIITVGFFTNIANLMMSSPDGHSSLSGDELIHKKVKKLVSMAGKFPEGIEFNIKEDAAAAKYTFENFKNPILLSGFEIGQNIKSGIPLIRNESIENSPVKDVFKMSIPQTKEDSAGRMSWDQTAVLAAIKGPEPFYNLDTGKIIVDQNGHNRWSKEGRNHTRLVEHEAPAEVQRLINELMMHQPQE